MKTRSLAILPLLLGGCSLTFYGVKDIKDEPKPKIAACVEPRPDKGKASAAALKAAPKAKPEPVAKPESAPAPTEAATATGPTAPAAPAPGAAPEPAADPGPDAHSPSVATKP